MTQTLEKPKSEKISVMPQPQNALIASRLEEVAVLLEEQHANPFRVTAYHRAAATLRNLATPVSEILQQKGLEGLDQLPTIGESIARAVRALVMTGRLPLLERLRGESTPEALLMSVPGIGHITAERLHDELGITSLEELELAAYDGRLHDVAGIGDKRLQGIRDLLTTRLGRLQRIRTREDEAPSIDELLEVDSEYLNKAANGELRRIAPRHFNPNHEAWLPILHTQRGKRHYTALFSNTAKAHELGKTHDWVVLYCDAGKGERQYTVMTYTWGSLKDKRVVRGREAECKEFYGIMTSH
jgi:DNA polymerase (family X)